MAPNRSFQHTRSGSWARARLRASPFAGELAEASLGVMPLADAREFSEVAGFEVESAAPILLSPRQRYDAICEIVALLRGQLAGLGPILVKLGGGEYRVSLPAELLREQVLLCHEPGELAKR